MDGLRIAKRLNGLDVLGQLHCKGGGARENFAGPDIFHDYTFPKLQNFSASGGPRNFHLIEVFEPGGRETASRGDLERFLSGIEQLQVPFGGMSYGDGSVHNFSEQSLKVALDNKS